MRLVPAPSFYRMKISEFIRMNFIGRPPTVRTIRAAIVSGQWAGEKVGSSYFIFVDEHAQPIRPESPTGNSGADEVLRTWSHNR